MEKRTLSELNLIDDFLFEEAMRRGEKGERFAKILLETILGREFRSVKVITQKNIRGVTPQNHGIRIDAYIEATDCDGLSEAMVEPAIYDIEPSNYKATSEPLKEIQRLVEEIREDEKVGVNYMKWWEREAYFKKEGRNEGLELQIINLVCKKLIKNKTASQIAEELETEETEIVKIIEAAREFAPEYDAEKILEKLNKI